MSILPEETVYSTVYRTLTKCTVPYVPVPAVHFGTYLLVFFLQEAIEIAPNTNYTAVATLKGLDSHYGTKGLRKVRPIIRTSRSF